MSEWQDTPIPLPKKQKKPRPTKKPQVFADLDVFTPEVLEATSIVTAHKQDKVFSSARAAIIKHNRSSLANFTDPLRIEALTNSATVYNATETDEVTLAIQYRDSTYLVPFKLVYPNKKGKHTLMCDVQGGWTNFSDWLAGLEAPPGRIGHGEQAYQAQFQWWSKNGKIFRLMDLPTELRLHHFIKEYAPNEVSLQKWFGFDKYIWSGPSRPDPAVDISPHPSLDPARKRLRPAQTALLRVSKQLNHELNDHVWKQVAKYWDHPLSLRFFITHDLPTFNFNALKFLELDFSNKEYINFFRVPLQPFRDLKDFGFQGAAEALKALPGVKELTLHFQSPMSAQVDDPWAYTGEYNGHEWYCDWNGNRDRDGFTTSCQRVLVDWILCAAYDYIKHIPTIHLAGAIKNSTKLVWDVIFKEAREGVQHEMEGTLLALGNLHDGALPPRCACSSPCAYYEYYNLRHYKTCTRPLACGCFKNGALKYCGEVVKKYKFDYED